MSRYFALYFFLILSAQSCSYDNLSEIYPSSGDETNCDTARVISYSSDIIPIMGNSCGSNNNCHKSGSSDSDIPLDDIRSIRDLAADGSLMGSILHQSGYEPMPDGGSQLSECSIQKIQAWINQGTLNN
jgi:hypothetical protein